MESGRMINALASPRSIRSVRFLILCAVLLSSTTTVNAALSPWLFATPVLDIVCALLCAMFEIAGALAALVFVYSGVRWIASQDDPGKRKSARDTMIHAIIGLIIVGVAEIIVTNVTIMVPTTNCGNYC